MVVDEKILKSMINELDDPGYINRLYDIYKLTSEIVINDLENGHKLLNKFEDEIYYVNGKTLSQQERLSIELKNIIRVNEKEIDINKKNLIEKKLQNILELMDEVFDKNIDENYIMDSLKTKIDEVKENAIFNMKKKISIMESELNIPITFFYAAYSSFEDIYKKYYKEYKKNLLLTKK